MLGSLSYISVELWTKKIHSFIFTVGPDGVVCISILHEPGDDKYGYETASERWLPVHTVETILVSVISMISDPNDESPANVDAAVSFVLLFNYAVCIAIFQGLKKFQTLFKIFCYDFIWFKTIRKIKARF